MTQKQRKEIALMWSAALIYQSGMDSFDNSTENEDSGDIVKYCQDLARKLLHNRPLLNNLPDIIKWVLLNK